MRLSKAAAGVSFFGALAIGLALAYVASGGQAESAEPVKVSVTYKLARAVPAYEVLVEAEDLEGVWKGTWDHGQVPCTLVIKRIEGDKFSGTLTEGEAEISFEGTFHAKERRVFFRETKVNKLGVFSEWSLGTNSGAFTPDGKTLRGTGIDKWGTYTWDLTKE